MELRDRVVLLTGASRGLGVDMAKAFARAGSRLALVARSASDLEAVREQVAGARAVAIPADVADTAALPAMLDRVTSDLGPVDVLVNNAGIEQVSNFESMTVEEIERLVHVNVTGLIALTRLALPSMIERRRGHVVNVSSVAGLAAVPHNTVYSATKHAVVGFSRSLRLELAEHSVGVSVVCPGFVDAGMAARWHRRPPPLVGHVRSRDVAEATVRVVQRNRAEAVVAPAGSKVADVVSALSPTLYGWGMRLSGALRYIRAEAEHNETVRRMGD